MIVHLTVGPAAVAESNDCTRLHISTAPRSVRGRRGAAHTVDRGVGYVWSDQCGVRVQHVGRVGSVVREDPQPRGGGLFVDAEGETVVGATGFGARVEILRVRR